MRVDLRCDDRDDEDRLVQSASQAVASAQWRGNGAVAPARAIACEHGNGDEGAAEEEVEEDGEIAEEADAANEGSQEDGEDEVDDGGTRHARDGVPFVGDGVVTPGECGKEVGEDAHDDGSAAEREDIVEGQDALQSGSGFLGHYG